jgi:hypothetical protein
MSLKSSKPNERLEIPIRLGLLLLLIGMCLTLFYGIELMNQAELANGNHKNESTK